MLIWDVFRLLYIQNIAKTEIYGEAVKLHLKKGIIDETTKTLACELIRVELIANTSINGK